MEPKSLKIILPTLGFILGVSVTLVSTVDIGEKIKTEIKYINTADHSGCLKPGWYEEGRFKKQKHEQTKAKSSKKRIKTEDRTNKKTD